MFPDQPQNQPAAPASLPGVPAQPQFQSVPAAGAVPLIANQTDSIDQVVTQARQLVLQYQQDPFRLSGALQQLKGTYLAEHYNITTKPAGN